MRNSKAKQIRRIAKRINNTATKYDEGKPPFYDKKVFKVIPGEPTVLNKDCHRFVYQKLKKGTK